MNTVSPQGPPGSMSPQHGGPARHGSPQPGMMQGMRPPMVAGDQMRGRFIRPTGAPGKEMRPRMAGVQGQRPPNFGPRQMMMRPGNPAQPYNSGPIGGSPAHQTQYGGMSPQHTMQQQQMRHPNAGGMSPQHNMQQGQQQMPVQQMRPPSAGGSVTSPATDRPVTPQTPRTPGPPTPGHTSQPPTPGQHPSQPPTPDQQQQFAQPSPQHIPHHMQQQQQFMQPQMQQQPQMQPQQQMQGGGGGNPGGPVPFMHDDFVQPRRGGWGPFIGLKGGRPMNNPNNIRQPTHMAMAVVTTAPLMTNVAQATTAQQQQQPIVNTTNNTHQATSTAVSSTLIAGGFTQVRPLQMTTSVRGPMMAAPQTVASVPTTNIPVRPNLQQMPPSSAHQANVGIPGGFNPREAVTFQSLQGASYSNPEAARYPNPGNSVAASTSASPMSSATSAVPPMPPVVSTVSAPVARTMSNPASAVNDIKSTMSLNCPVSATDVLKTPLTSVPTMSTPNIVSSGVSSGAPPPGAVPSMPGNISSHNAMSSSTVGQSVVSTTVLKGGPIVVVPSIGTATTTAASNMQSQQPQTSQPQSIGAGQPNSEQQQNALLKQLLSGSSASTTATSTTTSVTTSSLEAQLEKPITTEFKQITTTGLTTLASATPQPNSNTMVSTTNQPQQQPPQANQPIQTQAPLQQQPQMTQQQTGGPPQPQMPQLQPQQPQQIGQPRPQGPQQMQNQQPVLTQQVQQSQQPQQMTPQMQMQQGGPRPRMPQPTSQPQMTQITIRQGVPQQMVRGPTQLNLPTVPVPEASLRPQGGAAQPGNDMQPRAQFANQATMQMQPQQQPPQRMNVINQQAIRGPNGQMIMRPIRGQAPNLPQVPVSHMQQQQQAQQGIMRPMMVMNNGQQQQVMVRQQVPISQQAQMQQQHQGQVQGQQQAGLIQQQGQQQQQQPTSQGQQASQLQGLLQQQTLVPQNQLQSGQPQPQQGQVQQQQQQVQQQNIQQPGQQFVEQQQQQPNQVQPQQPGQPQQQQQQFVMQQHQQIRGPHPGMRPMMQGQVRGMGMPQQQQQQQMQMQQQRFRMQQFRGQMPTSASGEPLRPHFPPQQPMQVMRMPVTSGHQMMVGPNGPIQQQPPNQMMNQGPPHTMGPHHMRPPPPGMATGSLRLSIPPQQAMPPQPRTPGSTGSQQPSPALTPRSDMGDEMMDSNSSRGPTPAPGEGFEGMQEGFFNGEPPQKVVKRRASQPNKRRQSQSGMMMPAPGMPPDMSGPLAKKRARKGSRVDESDYDSYLDSVMSQLKNLPPVATVEPRLHHFYNACPLYGCGEMPKTFGYDLDTKFGGLEGTYGSASLPNEGDYYNTMPFGAEPPVPNIKTVTITAKGFYNQEFEQKPEKKVHPPPSANPLTPSPDLFYSSSPEPEENSTSLKEGQSKKSNRNVWHDLEPDESDEDIPMSNGPENSNEDKEIDRKPPKILERPRSPFAELVVPIPIKPKPAQTITLNAIKTEKDKENQDEDPVLKQRSKSVMPMPIKKEITSVTMTFGNNSNKSVLRVLNGLSKLLSIEPPKQWMIEDKNGATRDMFRCKIDNGDSEPMETSVDLQTVLTSGARFCRFCDTAVQANMVKKKTSELTFLTKAEREEAHDELYFCNADCYFKFAIGRADQEEAKDVKNLEELAELQAKQKAVKKESSSDSEPMDTKENEAPKHKGVSYKTYSPLVLKTNKKYKIPSENELTNMMFQIGTCIMPHREIEDLRTCLFCHLKGDGPADGPGRLLNYDVDKWVHLNCALWSEEVYETVSGGLVNVETALKNGVNFYCKMCEKSGATVKCFKVRCTNYYHVGCATKDRATFYKNKSVFCNQHTLKGEKDQELTTLAVYRRVFIERDENKQVAKVVSAENESLMRIGSLTFVSIGQLLPHQLHNFHNVDYIYPIGYKVIRNYWSIKEINKRCPYTCTIGENDNKPEFRVSTTVFENGQEVEKVFVDSTARGAWMQVLMIIDKLRKDNKIVKVFPKHISGEDLFGLNEINIIKVLESLPGIESLTDYNFKYGRNPLIELPLAVNPSGCARSEPQMRTRVKRVHNFQRTAGAGPGSTNKNTLNRAAKEMVPTLIGLETTGPYSKNFVQSKSSQYRKMKQEWRQNVVLARSGIQGLGLYAARDLERHQMIIEYIGEVIRSELTDIREKRYEEQNRGIYMFRLDDDRVLDATMVGGMARYVNHSCDPNCVTETVEVDRDLHIIIFANRRIARGEELSYDYKFDYEDDNRIPCLCGAKNCVKWMN